MEKYINTNLQNIKMESLATGRSIEESRDPIQDSPPKYLEILMWNLAKTQVRQFSLKAKYFPTFFLSWQYNVLVDKPVEVIRVECSTYFEVSRYH